MTHFSLYCWQAVAVIAALILTLASGSECFSVAGAYAAGVVFMAAGEMRRELRSWPDRGRSQ